MTQPSGIAGVFDRAADSYDAVGAAWFGPIARGLVAELRPAPGGRAIDVGCGRGAALFPLAEAVGPTGQVTGIDLSPRMVQRTAADAADLPQVQVLVADANAPGLPPGGADVVAASLVLFFLPDPAAALRSWVELLRPGGRLGVSTFGPQAPAWVQVDELFTPYLPPAMLNARTSGRRGPYASDEGVAALLGAAGLADVRTAHLRVKAVFEGPEQWLAFSWSHGQRAMWEVVPADRHEQVRHDAYALLEGLRDTDGVLSLRQDVRYTLGTRAT